jgi:hypothetical protein
MDNPSRNRGKSKTVAGLVERAARRCPLVPGLNRLFVVGLGVMVSTRALVDTKVETSSDGAAAQAPVDGRAEAP